MELSKPRVFSGIQPSGKLHIGNYIGAIKQWVALQDAYDSLFCIGNLHVLTIPEQILPAELLRKTREVAALYLACGINPQQCSIFVQSEIHEHSELAWILTCVTPVGWLERMTQYKSKADHLTTVGTGLLDYPVLQAADILLYETDLVPVGEDQRQHVELTRDIAERFNHLFGQVFKPPTVLIPPVGHRIMGLDDPTIKMSKSLGEIKAGHSIGLLDTPDMITRAIMSAVTDSQKEMRWERASRGVLNLLILYEALTGQSRQAIEAVFVDKDYAFLKKELLRVVLATLEPIQSRYRELMRDPAVVDEVLKKGAARVRPLAEQMMNKIKRAVGLV